MVTLDSYFSILMVTFPIFINWGMYSLKRVLEIMQLAVIYKVYLAIILQSTQHPTAYSRIRQQINSIIK